ncbi:hypothetical protein [Terrihabitans sp. B22-R8]|uniref:hypothetical protein n=1 Tax=Terrihabitans sp. B22-R8 TaxID=3425128 RepID=UPI00403D1ABC
MPPMFLRFRSTFIDRFAEWVLACILFSTGLMLLRPEETFAASPVYEGLARIATEEHWGLFCLVGGAIRLVALTINGAWMPTYHFRSVAAFLSCFFWLQFSLGLFGSGSTAIGVAVYPWLLLADIVCVYKIGRDFRMAKAAKE